VIFEKSEQLIVVRLPCADTSYSDFLPCQYCFGFFYRKELWRHCDKCKFRDRNPDSVHSCQKDAELLLAPYVYTFSGLGADLQHVLNVMHRDDVAIVVKNDDLILSYGELLASSKSASQFKHVSVRMRMLARLLMRLRGNTSQPDANLSSFIKPDKFDEVVCAVQQESKYEPPSHSSSSKISVPSVALKLGYALRKCSGLLINKALRDRHILLERDTESFTRLYDTEWKVKFSSVALRTLTDEKHKKESVTHIHMTLLN